MLAQESDRTQKRVYRGLDKKSTTCIQAISEEVQDVWSEKQSLCQARNNPQSESGESGNKLPKKHVMKRQDDER